MTDHGHNTEKAREGVSRRKVLECMTWAGTGVLWTISGGVPRSLGLVDQAMAQDAPGLTFLQISDSHVGFDRPANPNALSARRMLAKSHSRILISNVFTWNTLTLQSVARERRVRTR